MTDTSALDYPSDDDGFQYEDGYYSDPEEPLPTYVPEIDRDEECDAYAQRFLARERDSVNEIERYLARNRALALANAREQARKREQSLTSERIRQHSAASATRVAQAIQDADESTPPTKKAKSSTF